MKILGSFQIENPDEIVNLPFDISQLPAGDYAHIGQKLRIDGWRK